MSNISITLIKNINTILIIILSVILFAIRYCEGFEKGFLKYGTKVLSDSENTSIAILSFITCFTRFFILLMIVHKIVNNYTIITQIISLITLTLISQIMFELGHYKAFVKYRKCNEENKIKEENHGKDTVYNIDYLTDEYFKEEK